MKPIKVGVLLFDDVELLDFAGPIQVFSLVVGKASGENDLLEPFHVTTVSEHGGQISTRNGLKVLADHSLASAPYYDVLIVPGGYGTRKLSQNRCVLEWVRHQAAKATWTASVCTGAFVLAEAGLLDGKRATTGEASVERMRMTYQHRDIHIEEYAKYIVDGNIITSGGISTGIPMAFYLVQHMLGIDAALAAAKDMEYEMLLDDRSLV
ncbi:DJ-1/PfpI family protein [Neobacillus mesonae]|nr:DJ-1/PfpI family protein [Neobacillus mesonae]